MHEHCYVNRTEQLAVKDSTRNLAIMVMCITHLCRNSNRMRVSVSLTGVVDYRPTQTTESDIETFDLIHVFRLQQHDDASDDDDDDDDG